MTWDPVWEEVFRSQAWGKYPGEDLIRFVARNFYRVDDRRSIKILELGCGPGANLWYLAREGFSFCGVDGSAIAIEQARERLNKECPGWESYGDLHVGDIGNLQFDAQTFDAVIDNEAVCCNSLEASIKIYEEAARVTKLRGQIYVRTFATGCWGEGTGKNVGYNSWLCSEGPLSGMGHARFTSREDIHLLLMPYQSLNIEELSRSMNEGRNHIREWIITGRKES